MSEFVEQVLWNNVRRSFARLWILDILSTEGEIRTTDDDDAALRRLALQMIIRLLLSTPKPVAAESGGGCDYSNYCQRQFILQRRRRRRQSVWVVHNFACFKAKLLQSLCHLVSTAVVLLAVRGRKLC